MPFASGTYSLPSGNPVTTGTSISSSWANSTLSDIATALSSALLKDGTQTVTADLPMDSHKLTGLSAGSAAGNSVRYEQVFSGSTALTATGSTQTDALSIASRVNQISTTASGTGVKLTVSTGDWQMIYNAGANGLKVYPPTGGSINQLAANAPFLVPPARSTIVFAASSTVWLAIM